ncbi:MAG: hypothetical protein WCC48_09505 [Anaeromyxobacteraceae bacterium]
MDSALNLQLRPDWDAIRETWDRCGRHFESNGLTRDEAYGLCMVVQELLENAVKYGRFTAGKPPVELALDVTPQEVTVEVKSPVGVGSTELAEFDRTIQWIRGFQDPFEPYLERLKLASAQAWGSGVAGLGLTRVAYEGRCVLDFYVDASDTLAVSAVWRR